MRNMERIWVVWNRKSYQAAIFINAKARNVARNNLTEYRQNLL